MDIQGDGWKVLAGSCLDRLLELDDCSIDAVVTDPPYELGFMGKSWDSSGIAYNVEVWRQCLRVLKPGGHILAFGGSRTWHRLAVAIEDAGFELRDSIAWIYGSGFPKSLDVSKAIDKSSGIERKSDYVPNNENALYGAGMGGGITTTSEPAITDDAKKWQGWGTALKPAFEPVVVGRKPLTGTVAANVLKWGVGGLNIDGTRIGTDGGTKGTGIDLSHRVGDAKTGFRKNNEVTQLNAGRWPSNVMLDEYTAELLDEQTGILKSGKLDRSKIKAANSIYGEAPKARDGLYEATEGGASRFFYVAKASKRDRNEGLDGLEAKASSNYGSIQERSSNPVKQNFHPTVKPTELMRNLIRLVTPFGGTVLDPFTGSGSTGKAAILEGMQFVGCELTPEYLPIIQGRINYAVFVKEQELLAEDEKLF
jgi:site-specific DNA-methyltransferase (adenine-specific)